MKVVITGAAGFIGFHLAMKLKSLGHEVTGFDNFNSYYDNTLKMNRARKLNNEFGIEISNLDLLWPTEISKFIKDEKPDLVVHLAAYAGVRYSMNNPNEYIMNNILGTQHLINACENVGVENVIYASTSCTMHGNTLPWKENEKLGPQLSPYGYSKATNEHQFNISKIRRAVGLRFFTVYGPWGRPDMALFSFTKDILEGKEITIFNHGDMKRDFTYVDDIVQGIVLVSENMTERDIYNIGYGKQVSLLDFVEEIEKNIGMKAKKIFAGLHPADAKETWSDTSKLQKLGYKPTTPINEGVKQFINWYMEYYK
jgi:UDP-glucuronate 4-epimerase